MDKRDFNYFLEHGSVAGFDLAGVRLPNGTIRLMDGEICGDWPEELTIPDGPTYDLDQVVEGREMEEKQDGVNGTWENALYA